jgi:hypothetical protein
MPSKAHDLITQRFIDAWNKIYMEPENRKNLIAITKYDGKVSYPVYNQNAFTNCKFYVTEDRSVKI